jgi:serine/threonine protein phosphatase 1
MSAVRRFAANVDGRDFVVGDIHGCFDALRTELDDIAFDETKDRLFSVGDLVDRGPASEESIDWIGKPWFHAVRGNHEQMAIGVAAGKHDHMNYFSNGGAWFLGLPPERQKLYADVFEALPYAMEIETGIGRIGIVHAECCGESWDDFTWSLEHPESKTKLRNVTEIALWARSRIRDHDQTEIKGLRALFVGHTPVSEVCRLGNVVYVDTGAVFGKKLTVMQFAGSKA